MTDALGSVIATFSNVVGSAAVLANQVYGPYGIQRYQSGPMPTYTNKGFTGQYADSVTGLDYYNARYYDPAASVFLSADTAQGNVQGMNPYGYVGGNPETDTDPTGKYYAPPGGPGGPPRPPPCNQSNKFCGRGDGGNPGGGTPPPQQKKAPVKLGGCDPDTNQSDACAAWAWRASKVRNQRLDSLNFQATLEMLASYLLLITGDIINMIRGSIFDRISAGFDLISTIFNSVLPYLGQAFRSSSVYQAVLHFASVGMGIMTGLQAVIGTIRSVNWWIARPAEFTADLLLAAASGPAGIIVQGLFMLVKPMVGDILDSSAYYLQSLALSDYAEKERESSMPLQDWCVQYGGCPSYSS